MVGESGDEEDVELRSTGLSIRQFAFRPTNRVVESWKSHYQRIM